MLYYIMFLLKSCLKIPFGLLDYLAQNARSQSRQGFQPLRAFGILIKFIMAVQRTYTHNLTLSYIPIYDNTQFILQSLLFIGNHTGEFETVSYQLYLLINIYNESAQKDIKYYLLIILIKNKFFLNNKI